MLCDMNIWVSSGLKGISRTGTGAPVDFDVFIR